MQFETFDAIALRSVARDCGVTPHRRDERGRVQWLGKAELVAACSAAWRTMDDAARELATLRAKARVNGDAPKTALLERHPDFHPIAASSTFAPSSSNVSDAAAALVAALQAQSTPVDLDAVRDCVSTALAVSLEADGVIAVHMRKALEALTLPRAIAVSVNAAPAVTFELAHMQLEYVLRMAAASREASCGLWLFGAAGAGKTTIGEQVAAALGMRYRPNPLAASKYDLLGYTDSASRVVSTPFRDAFTNGGLCLLDEVDAYAPDAALALNSALANGHCTFPGDTEATPKHPDFLAIGCSNTLYGATVLYSGRQRPDAAFLDRFLRIDIAYDPALELALAGGNARWVERVTALRERVAEAGLRIIVSPRASKLGAAMLRNGFTEAEAIEATIACGLPAADRKALGL